MVYGFGVNDTGQKAWIEVDGVKAICPYYDRWKSMIRRCYSHNYKIGKPYYDGVFVDENWKSLSNFKAWMKTKNWQGMHLDKDLIGNGKMYSEESCLFIDPTINTFITNRSNYRGKVGFVGVDKLPSGKFRAKVSSFDEKKVLHLGVFSSGEEAFDCWFENKILQSKKLVGLQGQEFLEGYYIRNYELLKNNIK